MRFTRFLSLSGCLTFLVFCQQVGSADDLSVVGFDMPSVVVAQELDARAAGVVTTGGRLVRMVIPVSMLVSPEFRGEVEEYLVELESPQQTLRVVDFWPRQEVYSEVEGTVQVESKQQRQVDFNLSLSAGWEPFARGAVGGKTHRDSSVQETYQRKPPIQQLTASGTIRRGYGVFFKFRPGPLPHLEGAREIAILAEAPAGWRADMLEVTASAVGRERKGGKLEELGRIQLWTTLHLAGDRQAAYCARRFVQREKELRKMAAENHQRVLKKALPTWFHRMGAALDVVEPRIPADYLTQVLFRGKSGYLAGGQQRLPVDLRVAILDFWDARDELQALATGQSKMAAVDRSLSLTASRITH